MPKATRLSFPLAILLLGCTAMSSNAGWFDFGSKPEAPAKDNVKDNKDNKDNKDSKAAAAPLPALNLDDSIRQAQMLRLAGSYPEAIKHLSQLMMVASDDPRVVGEYGKTLAAMGRADDAVNFLTRAQQLQPNDWTIYSAMGVAYDQLGNQKDAQSAYERALAIKPGEPSVLSNYALSRMLAKDPDMAGKLAARAEIANASAKDPMIARNIAMIRSMAPQAPDMAMAVKNPAPAPQLPDNRVVMQRVPVDPLAGPVGIAATRAPRPLQAETEKASSKTGEKPVAKAEAPKSPVNTAAKTASAQAEGLQTRAEAIAKQPANKLAAIAAAKTEANKDVAPKANKDPATKTADNKPAPAPKVLLTLAVQTAEAKATHPAPAPKVLPPIPVKAADAKPAPQKTAAKPTDTIPGLRVSTNAY
jgi:Flp pilus assembly protein TadD